MTCCRITARATEIHTLRAAFDRDDALYLRDESDKARHRELELRDAEMGKFTRVRNHEDGLQGLSGTDSPARKRPAASRCADTAAWFWQRNEV